MTEEEAARLQHGFADWALNESSWRALALVGSWARGAERPDSDLDLVAVTTQLDRWACHDGWLRELIARLGFVLLAVESETHGVAKSWRAWLGCGVELELTLVSLNWAETRPVDPGTGRVVGDGMRLLVDKDGALRSVQEAVSAAR